MTALPGPHIRAHTTPLRPRYGDWMETFTGRKFYPLDPDPDEIDIVDIAWSLGHICRYNGHARGFYSVAQHSVLVSRRCSLSAAEGLMHDAAEAYLGDIIRPLKHAVGFIQHEPFEHTLERMIARKFGLIYPWPDIVKLNDEVLLSAEREFLGFRQPWGDQPVLNEVLEGGRDLWPPHQAAVQFMHAAVEVGVADPDDVQRIVTEGSLRAWPR